MRYKSMAHKTNAQDDDNYYTDFVLLHYNIRLVGD